MPADVAGALVLLGDMPLDRAAAHRRHDRRFPGQRARARGCAYTRRPARQPRASRARLVRGGDAPARRRGRAPADRLAQRRRTGRSRSARRWRDRRYRHPERSGGRTAARGAAKRAKVTQRIMPSRRNKIKNPRNRNRSQDATKIQSRAQQKQNGLFATSNRKNQC